MKKTVLSKITAIILCCVTIIGAMTACGKSDKANELFEQAMAYYNGDGVEQDYDKAVKLLNKAAKKGCNDARLQLGVLYYTGEIVEQDYDEAEKLFRKAADDGDATAQYNMGVLYENGNGVKQSEKNARKWYKKAAEQGNEQAQAILNEYDAGRRSIENGKVKRLGAHGWDWEKSHDPDGTMYIYTMNSYSGTNTDPSDAVSDAYMRLYQDKTGFYLRLYNENQEVIKHTGSSTDPFDAEFVWREGKKNEFHQPTSAAVEADGTIVRLSKTWNGSMMSSLQEKDYKDAKLYLYFPDDSTYCFEIPNDTDYHTIWEAVSDFWYIPTFNDDIYTGKDVNPDLVKYLQEFENAFNAEIEAQKQAGVEVTMLEGLLGSSSNSEFDAMYAKYKEMGDYLNRTVDVEYYAQCQSRIDRVLMEHMANQSSELFQDGADIARAIGFGEVADWLEIFGKGAGFLGNLLG